MLDHAEEEYLSVDHADKDHGGIAGVWLIKSLVSFSEPGSNVL